jgi:hypothetical protein
MPRLPGLKCLHILFFRGVAAVFLFSAALFFLCVTEAAAEMTDADPLHTFCDSGYLWLVNTERPLPAGYVPGDMLTYQGYRFRTRAVRAFMEMQAAMEKEGLPGVSLHSAYRPYERQQALYERKTREYTDRGFPRAEAEIFAAQTVQPPGASEHPS